jgi:hypothetical protein
MLVQHPHGDESEGRGIHTINHGNTSFVPHDRIRCEIGMGL